MPTDREFVMEYADYLHPSDETKMRSRLMPATRDRIDAVVWNLQDGYGEPGFTPVQGQDWSGIRDSSPQAFAHMAAAIRSILGIS